ncbi:hypothetical protein B0H10DRAFT_2236660 [Mycena sp. CBHHK59/15]|nr:hypothetical protein B0H10DRAFT_2236660 [Mycena sp. CBHHK59/15]
MPRDDGPYEVVKAFPERSEYTLKLPNNPQLFPGFHAHLLKRFVPNDPTPFPTREPGRPAPVITPNGAVEWTVEIVDERKRGQGKQYLARRHLKLVRYLLVKPRARKPSVQVMEDEEILMQALADAVEDDVPDDGAIKIEWDDKYRG